MASSKIIRPEKSIDTKIDIKIATWIAYVLAVFLGAAPLLFVMMDGYQLVASDVSDHSIRAESHLEKAKKLYEQKKWPESESALEQATKLNPNSSGVLVLQGLLNAGKGNIEEAGRLFKKAIKLDSNSSEAHLNLGNLSMYHKNVAQAKIHFSKAVAINPSFAEGYFSLGNYFLGLKSLDSAMLNFQKSVFLKPDMAKAHNKLGLLLASEGNFIISIEAFKLAVKHAPLTTSFANNLKHAHMALKKK